LSAAVQGLDGARLQRLLSDSSFVRRVEVRDSTGSTNDDARRLSRDGAPSGTVVVANHQRSGRGRLGRAWHSAPGLGLYLSVLIRPVRPVVAPTRWTLASALAACEACGALGCEGVVIEWPNDLYHGGRKLAGTLTELRSLGGSVEEVIVGTGFNVNHNAEDFPVVLENRATSLAMVLDGRPVDRERLASLYVERLGALVALVEGGGWEDLVAEWSRHAPGAVGTLVVVNGPHGHEDERYEALTRGVDDRGALRVERPDGTIESIHSNASVTWLEA
jgi:BirA family biotin operon repressor/biotin-[acetyl-CoA-carboxylase] ligase